MCYSLTKAIHKILFILSFVLLTLLKLDFFKNLIKVQKILSALVHRFQAFWFLKTMPEYTLCDYFGALYSKLYKKNKYWR